MTVRLNGTGRDYARSLIRAGKVDKTSAWSFDADDGNELLGAGGDDWDNYGRHFLGIDPDAKEKTKARFHYPVAKGGKVYRRGVIAAKDRAAQQGDSAIENAANALLEEIDGKDGQSLPAFPARMASPIGELLARLVLESGERILAIDESRALHMARDGGEARQPTQIAMLPLMGPLYPRGRYGGSMEAFRSSLANAVANPDVGAIVLDVDSPGGTYAGTPETAAAVRAANAVKPVVAHVDSLAASAAYFIASQAGQVVLTPSAEVGSIGTLAVHHDFSQMFEQAGIKTTIVRDPPHKAEGNMFEPLSAEARDHLQRDVSSATDDFVRNVAAGRRTSQANVRDNFGKGRTVTAQRAVDLGMADRIGTLSDVLAGLRTKVGGVKRRSSLAFL